MPESAKRYSGKKGAKRKPPSEVARPNANGRGYNYAWQRARIVHLNEYPMCEACVKNGLDVEATVVDHIIPHRGDSELFWNPENWQSLCGPCHGSKTKRGE